MSEITLNSDDIARVLLPDNRWHSVGYGSFQMDEHGVKFFVVETGKYVFAPFHSILAIEAK